MDGRPILGLAANAIFTTEAKMKMTPKLSLVMGAIIVVATFTAPTGWTIHKYADRVALEGPEQIFVEVG